MFTRTGRGRVAEYALILPGRSAPELTSLRQKKKRTKKPRLRGGGSAPSCVPRMSRGERVATGSGARGACKTKDGLKRYIFSGAVQDGDEKKGVPKNQNGGISDALKSSRGGEIRRESAVVQSNARGGAERVGANTTGRARAEEYRRARDGGTAPSVKERSSAYEGLPIVSKKGRGREGKNLFRSGGLTP